MNVRKKLPIELDWDNQAALVRAAVALASGAVRREVLNDRLARASDEFNSALQQGQAHAVEVSMEDYFKAIAKTATRLAKENAA